MGQNFNLKRSILLIKSIFITNKQYFTRSILLVIGAVSIAACLDIYQTWHQTLEYKNVGVIIKYVYMLMLIFPPMKLYASYKDKMNISTSQIVPVSINEKFFVPLFLSVVVFPLFIIAILIVLLSILFILSMAVKCSGMVDVGVIDSIVQYSTLTTCIDTIGQVLFGRSANLALIIFASIQSGGILYSVCDKKYAWIPIPLGFFIYLIIYLVFGRSMMAKEIIPYIVLIQILFFWGIAYYLFKKLQINK